MRKSVLALALATAAGSAFAQTTTPPTVSPGAVSPPSVGTGGATTPPMTPPSVASPQVTPPANPPGVTRQDLATPPTQPSSPTSPMPPSMTTTPPAASGGLSTAAEARARARIERDGYTNVTGLSRSADGVWRGTAMRGSTSVQVMVDARGNVTTQ
ncbi:MAG: hypothetical protein KF889_04945 [Alphaproteobacteria bacterium]|nr:hypothetical protein [Alphaproteobacteria bacterium]MCW5742216.1 hypothetical protein [Alphaproteobacteria bacterium]